MLHEVFIISIIYIGGFDIHILFMAALYYFDVRDWERRDILKWN